MTGDYSHNPQLGTLMALLQNYHTLAGHALHEWLEQRDEQERQATTAKEQKRRDRLDKATGHTDSNMYINTLRPEPHRFRAAFDLVSLESHTQ